MHEVKFCHGVHETVVQPDGPARQKALEPVSDDFRRTHIGKDRQDTEKHGGGQGHSGVSDSGRKEQDQAHQREKQQETSQQIDPFQLPDGKRRKAADRKDHLHGCFGTLPSKQGVCHENPDYTAQKEGDTGDQK